MRDFYMTIEHYLSRYGIGMRGKLISLFVVIKVVPLIVLAMLAWWQFEHLGEELQIRTEVLADKAKNALTATGDIAVNDAIKALDDLAREDIERMTTDLAKQIAAFLYGCDADIRYAAALKPDSDLYAAFLKTKSGRLVKQGIWELAPDNKSWRPAAAPDAPKQISSSNKENELNFHYRSPAMLNYEEHPLFLEMTYLGLDGQEIIKVVTSDRVSPELKDVSRRENTYARAENYFPELKKLKPGEIFVSDVIGTYVPSKLIGMFTPENAAKVGIPYEPEKAAFAGKENPVGTRFHGIVRWATPVVKNNVIVGYVTLALNHDHLMDFVDHVTPSRERYSELSDAFDGNYAFIWDHKGRSIAHPRHHSIVGFHPETGEIQTPWLEDQIYDRWMDSGQALADFLATEPTFVEQSVKKKPAPELTRAGLVGLDCRYLNFAPQCTGWFDLTSKGGSGSFNILWSGLRKLTTAATIPYFTGQYAHSPRGFGFVAIGAGLEDFHRPARESGEIMGQLIRKTDSELKDAVDATKAIIRDNLINTALSLGFSTLLMVMIVVLIAVWIASLFTHSITKVINGISRFRTGERQFRFSAPVKDELGVLCDSFDSMADSIENSVQGTLVITDIHQKVIYANTAFLLAINKNLDEVRGRPYAEVSFFILENPLECFLEGKDCDVEYHEPTGCYYKASAEEHKNEHGETIGYIVASMDVTSMVEAQRESEKQRLLLDVIFSASPDLIWYKDTDGHYLAVNPRFVSAFGTLPSEIADKTVTGTLSPNKNFETAHHDDQLVIKHQVPVRTEEEILFSDGKVEIVESVRTPIFDKTGALVGILGVARDITERTNIARALRQTQSELEKTVEYAERANTAKSQFLANMSHEIRTPMNAILGFSYIALQGEMPNDLREMFAKIHSAALGLLGIINDILDFSKIEARKLDLEVATFSLKDHLVIVHDIIKFRAQEKGIDLSTFFGKDVEKNNLLQGDAARLRQILINLLGNAVKFTEVGGVVLEIEIEEQQGSELSLRFSVYDTGIGIRTEVLHNLFQPFAQADGSVTRRFGGTGLGLVISKDLIELMGGRIGVESEPGFGSTFSFVLPFKAVTDKSVCAQTTDESTVEGMKALVGKHVLVVEDNEINQLIAQSILEQAGITVSIANNGKEAVQEVAKGVHDLVLMDIQMPIMDGLEATRRIRDLPNLALPIVAMTAHAMSDDHQKSLAAGMNDHITKPIEPELLYATLIRWMVDSNESDPSDGVPSTR